MKFTNGFWMVKDEFKADYVRDLLDVEETEDEVRFYGPYQKINGRGDTLNVGLMTYTITAPMPDVLGIRMQNHMGNYVKSPKFELTADMGRKPVVEELSLSFGDKAACEFIGKEWSFTSGRLSLHLTTGNPCMSFEAEGKQLTRIPAKTSGMMHRNDGRNFIVSGLNLGVGELVYGLGERFTAMVKNGQSVEMWNEDGGTASEISYKNIPFYYTTGGYGVFVNHPGRVGFEVASEKVETVQFSVEDEEMEYFVIYGPTPKEIITKYTAMTGRPALPPEWSFGLWLTTSFTTNYDEETVTGFIEGFEKRNIPLDVFHFDCFWMKRFQWCDFAWDPAMFPDPKGMLQRLHDRGLHICVWINPYIAQKSPLFKEGMDAGYLVRRPDGRVWQWDLWQAGMALVDFTNPDAYEWYQGKLRTLLEMGVDAFKTDFGERIPTDVVWHDGSDPQKMHNYYTHLYNGCVFDLLTEYRGEGEACLFARSATAGGQQFPVHWGGDSTSQYVSMAETLRAGLSLMDSGFGFWSHDIGGFEDDGSADLYKRWVAFGLLSSHSRLHGSSSYRVPWNYDEEACDVVRFFANLKKKLMPYIQGLAQEAHESGVPVLRPMHMVFPDDPACAYLDQQYMLGDRLLVAPVFSPDGKQKFYLPEGSWTHLLDGSKAEGGRYMEGTYDYFSLPLYVKDGGDDPLAALIS
ncbi:MAG: alpha-xylosidase [Blautia sp.]|nr:alpha-xylosidase [Blautia sp.]